MLQLTKPMPQVYREAATLIRQGWTRRSYARRRGSQSVPPTSKSACCWCAVGALMAAAGVTEDVPVTELERDLAAPLMQQLRLTCIGAVISWNDEFAKDAENVAAVLEAVADRLASLATVHQH